MTVRGFGPVATYSDPMPLVYRVLHRDEPVVMVNAPGQLTGDNVLTDANGVAWLTDFADAGPIPELWSYVALEAAIRFDWIDPLDFKALYALARILTTYQLQQVTIQDVDPAVLRKPIRTVQTVRRLAAEQAEVTSASYPLGLLLQAVSRLVTFDPTLHLTVNELTRFAYIWISAAMTAQQLNTVELLSAGSPEYDLYIDQLNHVVWVDGRHVKLRGQSYSLLCYLYERAGQLCHRRELVENVFLESFDDFDESQRGRLNTAISRLRERLGDNRRQPRYLFTETGDGYRLVAQPSTPT